MTPETFVNSERQCSSFGLDRTNIVNSSVADEPEASLCVTVLTAKTLILHSEITSAHSASKRFLSADSIVTLTGSGWASLLAQ